MILVLLFPHVFLIYYYLALLLVKHFNAALTGNSESGGMLLIFSIHLQQYQSMQQMQKMKFATFYENPVKGFP